MPCCKDMNALAQAILDGNLRAVREILHTTPEAACELAPSGRTMLELAQAKGIAQIVAALLCRRAPGADSFADHRGLLESCLREISTDWMMAGSYEGLEVTVWSLLANERAGITLDEEWGSFELAPQEVAEWLFMVEAAGGWPTANGFMALDEWLTYYACLPRPLNP